MTVRQRGDVAPGGIAGRSATTSVTPEVIATATIVIETRGQGFTEFTREAARFIAETTAMLRADRPLGDMVDR